MWALIILIAAAYAVSAFLTCMIYYDVSLSDIPEIMSEAKREKKFKSCMKKGGLFVLKEYVTNPFNMEASPKYEIMDIRKSHDGTVYLKMSVEGSDDFDIISEDNLREDYVPYRIKEEKPDGKKRKLIVID